MKGNSKKYSTIEHHLLLHYFQKISEVSLEKEAVNALEDKIYRKKAGQNL